MPETARERVAAMLDEAAAERCSECHVGPVTTLLRRNSADHRLCVACTQVLGPLPVEREEDRG